MNRTASPSQIVLLLAAAGLAAFGLFYIYSTGYVSSDFPVRPNWLRQCVFMAVGAAAALRFDCPDDPQSVEMLAKIERDGVEEALAAYSGLERDSGLFEEILQVYHALAKPL